MIKVAISKKSLQKQLTQSIIENQGLNFKEWEEEQVNQAKVDLMMNPRNSVWNEVLKEAIYAQFLQQELEKQVNSAQKKPVASQKSSDTSKNESANINYQNEKKEG